MRARYLERRLDLPELTDHDHQITTRDLAAVTWALDTFADLSPELCAELEAAQRRADDIERTRRERDARRNTSNPSTSTSETRNL